MSILQIQDFLYCMAHDLFNFNILFDKQILYVILMVRLEFFHH